MRNASQRRAFTLIELLVVIAIIGLLAAILFPVFARARENARRASCQSNMKQIGLGMMQYVQDFDERFPRGIVQSGAPGQGWAGRLYPYLKSKEIFRCPSDSTKATAPKVAISYFYNNNFSGLSNNPFNSDLGTGWHMNSVSNPARSVLVWEASGMTADPSDENETTSHGYNGWHERGGNPASGLLMGSSGGSWASAAWINGDRHLEGSNFLAADGHVKWYLGRNVCGGQSASSSTNSGCGPTGSQGANYTGTNAAALTFSPQ